MVDFSPHTAAKRALLIVASAIAIIALHNLISTSAASRTASRTRRPRRSQPGVSRQRSPNKKVSRFPARLSSKKKANEPRPTHKAMGALSSWKLRSALMFRQTWIMGGDENRKWRPYVSGENQPITSSAGAMGLMQVMPSTYQDMRLQYRLGADRYDPHDNILAGRRYLRWLSERYPYPALFAAYNYGPGNLEERMMQGGLLPAETRDYVGTVTLSLKTGDAILRWKEGEVHTAGRLRRSGSTGRPAAWFVQRCRASTRPASSPSLPSGAAEQGVRESVAQARAIIRGHRGGSSESE